MFQNSSTQKAKTELLFFLTPHVAQLPDRLQAMSRDEQRGLTLTTQAVGPGVYEEHMRGLQRGESPQSQPSSYVSPVKEIPLAQPSGNGQ